MVITTELYKFKYFSKKSKTGAENSILIECSLIRQWYNMVGMVYIKDMYVIDASTHIQC